jgi:hypothetical protein
MRARSKSMLVTCLAILTVTTACGSGSGGHDMQPTITSAEANRRVEDYATQVREALPPNSEYKLTYSEEQGDCSDPSDNGAKGRVLATRTYQVLGLDKAKIPSYFDAVKTWWQSHNFRVLDNTPPTEFLLGEHNADGFRMTLKSNDGGELFIVSTSPCIWPNGTPEPEALGTDQPDSSMTAADGGEAVPAAADAEPTPPTAPNPPRARRPRPAVDDEDFSETDWTDDGS